MGVTGIEQVFTVNYGGHTTELHQVPRLIFQLMALEEGSLESGGDILGCYSA